MSKVGRSRRCTVHDRERFSHELTLVFADGKTQVLTHEKKESA